MHTSVTGFSDRYERHLNKIMHKVSKSQLDRFKEAARELGADDDEAKFNEKLGKLVKSKPEQKGEDDGR